MQMRLLTIGLVLVLGLGLWNAWSLSSLNTRLAAMDGATPSSLVSSDVVRTDERGSKVQSKRMAMKGQEAFSGNVQAMSGTGDAPSQAIDLENPEVRDAIAQIVEEGEFQRTENRRKEQTGMYIDSLTREIDTFAEEVALDDETRNKVIREVEARTQAYIAVKNDVKDGELSWFDAREEFRAIKDEGAANLRGLLGDEQFEELSGRLWGGRGRGK